MMYTIHGIHLEDSARYLINVEGPNPGFVSRCKNAAQGIWIQYSEVPAVSAD